MTSSDLQMPPKGDFEEIAKDTFITIMRAVAMKPECLPHDPDIDDLFSQPIFGERLEKCVEILRDSIFLRHEFTGEDLILFNALLEEAFLLAKAIKMYRKAT